MLDNAVISINSEIIQKPARNSSIELLRILAACFVIVLHYNGMGRALEVSTGATHQLLMFLESLCVCAVDLFIMISGYFLCTTQKRTLDKPVYLLLLLWIIDIITYVAKGLITGGGISLVTTIHLAIPPASYFLILYLTLYIVSPFINVTLNKLTNNGRTIMVVVFLLLFSVYPTLMDSYQLVMHHEYMGINPVGAWGQQHGYTIVGFMLCYVIGAWLRLNNLSGTIKIWKCVLLIIVTVLGVYVWFLVETHTVLRGSSHLIDFNALSYSNPLVLALSSLLLLLFLSLNFHSKIINSVAKAAFTCYIFHLSLIPFLRVEDYATTGGLRLFIHLLVSIIIIYSASWLLWKLLDSILKPITNRLRNKALFKLYEK